ncbi:DUF1702 family protein [Micromonospora sp. WMMA1998]|uniref:DUF1702 family protein n=1 Tax=Micromonospora sp. WMMA1998 TaxID=3015167 RepID=UPI00248B23F6|nr:DUF1702 family protein [Micromonospora sp. WMMA1998]WBC14944.1 DUF1702 family protein [Micromonospora sp. WMMA1998]
MSAIGKVRRLAFGVPSAQAVFSRPGFAPEAWQRFAPVARSLVAGYHATLEDSRLDRLVPRLEAVDRELHGFAYEGAGMGLAALDLLTFTDRRLTQFVQGPGAAHIYPVYVGVGLALARLRRDPEAYLRRLDPLLGWIVVDGYGFHEAFFKRRRYLERRQTPGHLSSYAQRVFDQGMGRAIWFSCGGVVPLVVRLVDGFPEQRHGDLWSGVGLASAYGGGADRTGLRAVQAHAQPYTAQLARGAATAAAGRELAGNQTAHTELACQVYCGMSAAEAADTLDRARRDLPTAATGTAEPVYEAWRRRTEALLSV